MITPCKRHKADKSVEPEWRAVSNQQRTCWAIAVIHRCARCLAHMSPRIATHTVKPTQREALLAYGIERAKVDELFPPPESPLVQVPLSSWPFPVSAHIERPPHV